MVDRNPILALDQAQAAAELERSVHRRSCSSSESSFHNIGCYAGHHSWIREICPAFENHATLDHNRGSKDEFDTINITLGNCYSTCREWRIGSTGLGGPQNVVTWRNAFKLKRPAGVNSRSK